MKHEIFHRDMFLSCQFVREIHCGCILKVFGYKDRRTEGRKPAVTNDCIFKNQFSLFRKTRFLCCKGVIFFHFFHSFWYEGKNESYITYMLKKTPHETCLMETIFPKGKRNIIFHSMNLWIPPVRFLFFFDEQSIVDDGCQKCQCDRSFKT